MCVCVHVCMCARVQVHAQNHISFDINHDNTQERFTHLYYFPWISDIRNNNNLVKYTYEHFKESGKDWRMKDGFDMASRYEFCPHVVKQEFEVA